MDLQAEREQTAQTDGVPMGWCLLESSNGPVGHLL